MSRHTDSIRLAHLIGSACWAKKPCILYIDRRHKTIDIRSEMWGKTSKSKKTSKADYFHKSWKQWMFLSVCARMMHKESHYRACVCIKDSSADGQGRKMRPHDNERATAYGKQMEMEISLAQNTEKNIPSHCRTRSLDSSFRRLLSQLCAIVLSRCAVSVVR